MAGPVVVIVNEVFKIGQHDLRPYLPFTLYESDGTTPLVLPPDATVDIVVAAKQTPEASVATAAKFRKECVMLDLDTGEGEYRWETGDTATAGSFSYQFKIMWPGTTTEPQTVPIDSYLDLLILDDLT